MRTRAQSAVVAGVVALAFLAANPGVARANPEAGPYDSRSIGAGLTGLAWLERPAALAINPANLQGVDNLTLSLSATGIFANQFAPVEGADSQLQAPGFGPVGAIFGAGRIHERVVIGLGVYLDAGYGAAFEDVTNADGQCPAGSPECHDPQRLEVTFFQGEAALGASVRALDDPHWGTLDVGLALRLPFSSQTSDTYQEVLPGTYGRTEQSVFGVGLPGVRFGLTYRPTPWMSFAVSYRSKTRTTMRGDVTTFIPRDGRDDLALELDAETDWYSPHMLHLGTAFWFLGGRLMTTLEYRIQFHEEANQEQVITVTARNDAARMLLGEQSEITAPFLWTNVHSIRLGVEGWAIEDVFAIRGGYNVAKSATTEEGAQYFTPPHGWNNSLYLGLGFELGEFALDLAGAFTWASNTVEEDGELCRSGVTAKVGCAGDYDTRTWWLSATVTYQL